jgi:Fe-S cluster biogenesis protein NfuA
VVRLRGACGHCHARDMTLHGALEPRLRQRLPWITGLRALES